MRPPKSIAWTFLLIAAIPVLAASTAGTLMLAQGGFGGGHGQFDFWLFILGLPGILALFALPARLVEKLPDIVLMIGMPLAINLSLCSVCSSVARWMWPGDSGVESSSSGS